jgi:vacuolar-type H+-ATPase subunit E/Vma4
LSILQIKSHIQKETELEIQDILQRAEVEARTIIEDAKNKAATLMEEQKQKLSIQSLAAQRSELAILRMNQKAELTKLKADWLNQAFEKAHSQLRTLAEEVDSNSYKELLISLVLEGMVKMKGAKFTIQSDNQGSELLRRNLKIITKKVSEEKGTMVELEIESNPDLPPGAIIQSSDKRQYYNSTLDAILTGAKQRLSGTVYEALFSMGE